MHRKENVKKVWNDAAEPWTEFVREGKDHYRDRLNNPATLGIIGDIRRSICIRYSVWRGI